MALALPTCTCACGCSLCDTRLQPLLRTVTQVTLEASWWRGGASLGAAACAQVAAVASEVLLEPPAPLDGDDGGDEARPPLRLQLQFTSANFYSSCKALWEVSGVPCEAWAQ